MPDLDPEYLAVLPTLKYNHKPAVGGAKCVLCGSRGEYQEANPHIRANKGVGPKGTTWLCPVCHAKVMGEPVPEPQAVEQPKEDPAGTEQEQTQNVPEPSRSETERDRKDPEVIPAGPVTENNGTEPEPIGTEKRTEVEPPRPPAPVPCLTRPQGDEYRMPDVLGDVSLGIIRDAVGFIFTFYRQGNPVGSHTSKTPPWLSQKVVTDTAAALGKVCPDLPFSKEHIRDALGDVFKTVGNAIQTNPKAAAVLMPPAIVHVLGKVDRVAVTMFKDGLGGGEPIYELFTGRDEEDEPRTVTLNLGDITAETPGLFKRRWTSVFVTDFLELNREDWVSLRRALIDRAEVREVEHTGEGDALISDLLQELRFLTFTTRRDKWKDNPKDFLLCEHTPDGWLIYVNAVIVASFLKKNDITDLNAWTQKLSKACKTRDLTAGLSKKIRVCPGPQGTIRVWVFKGAALGFHEDMLVERVVVPNVPGLGNVPGKEGTTPEQPGNGRRPEQGTEGV